MITKNTVTPTSTFSKINVTYDLLGGLAAMLVAFPSAIAFGLIVYMPLGHEAVAQGAISGVIGVIIIGFIAALLGGTPRLISGPSAPAAAVLAAFVVELMTLQPDISYIDISALIMIVIFLAGIIQFLLGICRCGRLIKYVPYPVVSGFQSSVSILICIGQLPKFLGTSSKLSLLHTLLSPQIWSLPALYVGASSILAMIIAPKITRTVPATILAVLTGMLVYGILGYTFYPELLQKNNNPLVIGVIQGGSLNANIIKNVMNYWQVFIPLFKSHIDIVFAPAITLAILLSIDTLKTCIVVDTLTRSRHDSNRELIAQGLGNFTAGIVGGMAGSGMTGATLVNLTSGGKSRFSGVYASLFSLIAIAAFSQFIAWVPVSALAGILIILGLKTIDQGSLKLPRTRSTVLDFAVIISVIIIALSINLIAAAGVGLALAILLFLREQIRASVVHRQVLGNQLSSKKQRLPTEIALLETQGSSIAIFELQGPLFFGTADQLFTELEAHLAKRRFIILDFRQVKSIDISAMHMLEQIADQATENGAWMLFSNLPTVLPGGQNIHFYFKDLGLVREKENMKIFPELDDALEWAEDRLLRENGLGKLDTEAPLSLGEIDLFTKVKPEFLQLLENCIKTRLVQPGESIFSAGDQGDELFLIRKGLIRIMLPIRGEMEHHLATFGRGNFFGELAFLDKGTRSANAVATTPCELFILAREEFDQFSVQHRAIEALVFERLARALSFRLRLTNYELSILG